MKMDRCLSNEDYCHELWKAHALHPEWAVGHRHLLGRFQVKGYVLDLGCGFGHMVVAVREKGQLGIGLDSNFACLRKGRDELRVSM